MLCQLADNADWMNRLGCAFVKQREEVLTIIQLLRYKAISIGNLCSNEHLRVVQTVGCVQILPVNPQVICVPVYDPQIVYVHPCVDTQCPPITCLPEVPVGPWLCHDFDWCDHHVYECHCGGERPWWHCGYDEPEAYWQHRPVHT